MKEKRVLLQIAVAAALGAGTGGAWAVIFGYSHLCWLGVVVGAFVGFVACDPKEVLEVIFYTVRDIWSSLKCVALNWAEARKRRKALSRPKLQIRLQRAAKGTAIFFAGLAKFAWDIAPTVATAIWFASTIMALPIMMAMHGTALYGANTTTFGALTNSLLFFLAPSSAIFLLAVVTEKRGKFSVSFPVVNWLEKTVFKEQEKSSSGSFDEWALNDMLFKTKDKRLFRYSVIGEIIAYSAALLALIPLGCLVWLLLALDFGLTVFLKLAVNKRITSMTGAFSGSLYVVTTYKFMAVSIAPALAVGIILAVFIAVGSYTLKEAIEAKDSALKSLAEA